MGIIITEISRQQRRDDRYNIYTEDGFLLSLSDETIIKNSIKKGMELCEDKLEKLRRGDTFKSAKELSANYISRGPKTRKEIFDYLLKKGIDSESAEQAISLLEGYGYVDDEAYAKEFSRIYSKKSGSRVIRQKLMAKGISSELAEKYSHENHDSQQDAAAALAEKYAKKYSDLPPIKRRQKIYAALLRKGFSYDEASKYTNGDYDDEC